jgi:glutamate racemase
MSIFPGLNTTSPLLVFDSGIGGLSVLRAIKAKLPNAPIVYAADYAGMPYGTKSEAEIAARVPALLGRLVERYKPALVIIACNTACTIALSHVRAALDVPVVGTVPAIKPASLASKTGVIGLLGTQATIRQPYVDQLQAKFASKMTLLRHAAPSLVHAAEAKMRGEQVPASCIQDAISGLTEQVGGDRLDIIVLGCTHFPLLERELRSITGPSIGYVDGAQGIARRVAKLSEGREWPTSFAEGIFVTSGQLQNIEPYRISLENFGLSKFEAL